MLGLLVFDKHLSKHHADADCVPAPHVCHPTLLPPTLSTPQAFRDQERSASREKPGAHLAMQAVLCVDLQAGAAVLILLVLVHTCV